VRYVLDCSVALKWFVPEPLSDKAFVALDRFRTGDIEFLAPEVCLAELGHGLRKRVIGKEITAAEAGAAWTDVLSLDLDTIPTAELGASALALALDHLATFYDALYIALAARDGLKVLTADDRMVNAFAGLNRTASLADF
jgi:predicted nucleic acid-binding protein